MIHIAFARKHNTNITKCSTYRYNTCQGTTMLYGTTHVPCVYFCEQSRWWDEFDLSDPAPQLLARRVFPSSYPSFGEEENNIYHVVDACELLAREVCYRTHTRGGLCLGHDPKCTRSYEEIQIHLQRVEYAFVTNVRNIEWFSSEKWHDAKRYDTCRTRYDRVHV